MKLLHDLEVGSSKQPGQTHAKLKIKMLKSQRLKQGLKKEPKNNLTMQFQKIQAPNIMYNSMSNSHQTSRQKLMKNNQMLKTTS